MVNKLNFRRTQVKLSLLALFALIVTVPGFSAVALAADSDFASPLFQNVWQRTDQPLVSQKASRSWYWGPKPLGTGGFYEEYAEAPGGKRLVQYFDKSRMELTEPSKGNVTNGLLVVEMIIGKVQRGDFSYADVPSKSNIPVAGDNDNSWPTYNDLNQIYSRPVAYKVGDQSNLTFYPAGQGKQDAKFLTDATKISSIQNGFGVPAAFWDFMNRKGTVYKAGDYSEDTISDWLFSTGYPVAEPYWTEVKVSGVRKQIMFQAFERRVLTYTPSNDPAFQVEMGNVGLHYINWRYKSNLPQGIVAPPVPVIPVTSSPAAQPFLNSTAEWYAVTSGGLNVRTGAATRFPRQVASETQPYIQTLVQGDHVQAIAKVKGEEVDPGNDVWLQIYRDPDLFVYSGGVKKIVPGDFPTPSATYKGIWVAVSIDKQIMAVYEDNKVIYKTFISSGIPSSDPEKDHRTPKGKFAIIGSYRPLSQTMEGGNSDKAIGDGRYKIENIRNVNYFFEDYSIHGSYWHAKYGIMPMSHGCVNATVYDASLIYGLKAGTTVYVF